MRKSVDVRTLVGSFFVKRMRCAREVAALLAKRCRGALGGGGGGRGGGRGAGAVAARVATRNRAAGGGGRGGLLGGI